MTFWGGFEATVIFIYYRWECNTLENSLAFLIILKVLLPYDPEILLPGEMKTCIKTFT